MDALRQHCNSCQIAFALAEHYIWHEGKPYHENCRVRLERKARLKEFILRHCAENGLTVVPHHPNGR